MVLFMFAGRWCPSTITCKVSAGSTYISCSSWWLGQTEVWCHPPATDPSQCLREILIELDTFQYQAKIPLAQLSLTIHPK